MGSIADISIGAVTGDVSYFLLRESDREALGLPLTCVRPILSHARHLTDSSISHQDWSDLRDANERIWLFDPTPETLAHTAVRSYIAAGESGGKCNRDGYKIRGRNPWFRVPRHRPADAFLSGMSELGPWLAIRRKRELLASNTLYTVRFKKRIPLDEIASWSMSLLSSRTARRVACLRRSYPAGLSKLEPGDLKKLPLVIPQKTSGALGAYGNAVDALLNGHTDDAHELADRWLSS